MTDEAEMRHVPALDRIGGMVLLLVHLAATAALAGLVWVVQLVVYPSFLLVGGIFFEGLGAVANIAANWLFLLVAWTVVLSRSTARSSRRPAPRLR